MRKLNSGIAKQDGLLGTLKKYKTPYLFLLPFTILFFTFTILPVLAAMGLSFTSFDMIQRPRWVGLQNYIRLFLADEIFLIAVKNTLIFAAITGPVGYILCFIFAWLINEMLPRIRSIFTLLFYAPSISGIAFVIWTIIFSGDSYGYLNGLLLYWGVISEPILWLKNPDFMMPIVIIVVLWMSLGTSFLVFIAGLQGVDRSLYEAAAIDGIKNRWQELWYITLPLMRQYLMFGAIMSITGSFTAASQIQLLTGNLPTDYATWTIMQHINDYGLVRYEMGYASAVAVILFLFMVWVQRSTQKILKRIGS